MSYFTIEMLSTNYKIKPNYFDAHFVHYFILLLSLYFQYLILSLSVKKGIIPEMCKTYVLLHFDCRK